MRAPDLLPSDPTPGTRPAEALSLLLERGSIDQREFLDDAGGWRLSDAIYELRRRGWPIETIRVQTTSAAGKKSRIARYRLDRAAVRRHQEGNVAPELAGWLALAIVAVLLGLAGWGS